MCVFCVPEEDGKNNAFKKEDLEKQSDSSMYNWKNQDENGKKKMWSEENIWANQLWEDKQSNIKTDKKEVRGVHYRSQYSTMQCFFRQDKLY